MGTAKILSAGRPNRSLADALLPRTRQRILGLLYGNPGRMLHTAEIIRLAKTGSGAAQRELARLYQSGLLLAIHAGNQVFYEANPDSPIFNEMVSIVAKTVGLAEPLREALRPLIPDIKAAFVFGSVAQARDRAQSDIDLMVVSDRVSYADVFRVLEPLSEWLGRRVNPTLYTADEYQKRIREGNPFITRVLQQPKIWLTGGEDVISN
jgi:predicted nucleotidyltransferase